MPAPTNPPGPVGQALRRTVHRVRVGKGLSYQGLADRMATTGRPIPPISLRRIEYGTRRVDVDDLMSLCVALDLCPVDALVPATVEDSMPWGATTRVTVPAGRGRAWIGGSPLPRGVMDAERLAEVIRWMPRSRARELARAWGVGR